MSIVTTATESVDKSGRRVQRMFGQIAHRYDLMNHVLSGGVDVYWRWRTVRDVAPREDAPILDVCSGTGDLAFAYWKNCAGRAAVVATDFTHEMLVRAAQKRDRIAVADNSGRSGITFLEADTQHLPFGDDQFQIVCVAFGLRNVSDTRSGLREMTRVCRPGGRVAVLEFSRPRNRLFGALYQAYFRHVLPRIGQWLARNRELAYQYLPESVSQFPDGEALADLMRGCGLEPVTFRPLTWGVATLYVGTKPVVDRDLSPAGERPH
jgi:demethylmenaquinone methyltransferase/2-methoxy-6-polyprenyl-1,4-benzoquinol methylase